MCTHQCKREGERESAPEELGQAGSCSATHMIRPPVELRERDEGEWRRGWVRRGRERPAAAAAASKWRAAACGGPGGWGRGGLRAGRVIILVAACAHSYPCSSAGGDLPGVQSRRFVDPGGLGPKLVAQIRMFQSPRPLLARPAGAPHQALLLLEPPRAESAAARWLNSADDVPFLLLPMFLSVTGMPPASPAGPVTPGPGNFLSVTRLPCTQLTYPFRIHVPFPTNFPLCTLYSVTRTSGR
jgi:hypothetical protein